MAHVTVTRRVSRQGTTSLWDRPLRIGRRWADQPVVLTFDAARRRAIVRDERGTLLHELVLSWLTLDWLWADVPVTDHLAHTGVTSTGP